MCAGLLSSQQGRVGTRGFQPPQSQSCDQNLISCMAAPLSKSKIEIVLFPKDFGTGFMLEAQQRLSGMLHCEDIKKPERRVSRKGSGWKRA